MRASTSARIWSVSTPMSRWHFHPSGGGDAVHGGGDQVADLAVEPCGVGRAEQAGQHPAVAGVVGGVDERDDPVEIEEGAPHPRRGARGAPFVVHPHGEVVPVGEHGGDVGVPGEQPRPAVRVPQDGAALAQPVVPGPRVGDDFWAGQVVHTRHRRTGTRPAVGDPGGGGGGHRGLLESVSASRRWPEDGGGAPPGRGGGNGHGDARLGALIGLANGGDGAHRCPAVGSAPVTSSVARDVVPGEPVSSGRIRSRFRYTVRVLSGLPASTAASR